MKSNWLPSFARFHAIADMLGVGIIPFDRGGATNRLLLEIGDDLLLETGDGLQLES